MVRTVSFSAHNECIDLLRGFSILSVIFLHCYIHMPFINNVFPQNIFNLIFRSGYYGVIIFFVVSGFLITSASLIKWANLRNISSWQFYQMRFARIMPCFLVLLMILGMLDMLGVPEFVIKNTSLAQTLFSALTFRINWLEAKVGYLPINWDILWSLSVEEVFYLLFPLACFIFRKPYHFALLMCIFIVIGPFARVSFTDNEIWSDHSYLSCMDGIAIGCLAALISRYYKLNKKQLFCVLISGILLSSFIFILRKQAYDVGISKVGLNVTILEIGIGLILIATHDLYLKGNLFGLAPLRWFGRNSYEIYLTHSFCIIVIAKILFNTNQSVLVIVIWYALATILSGIIGQLVSAYFPSQ